MKFFRLIFNYLTTRYTKVQLIVILVVIIFGFFISDSSIFSRLSHDAKIMELNGQIEYYREQAVQDREKLEQLQDDREHIEKFARENYLMKRPDEDIFIIE
ncbi:MULTISPECIES: FtsB family cell division protein [unclassified Dysgonomonas]|uniref:FtsB family cell division protein n=1 Tax=unclassified Dysgonomonas TaxID=2630389 RepID=UPI0013EBA9E2|nr:MULTISPECIES: septum formation initiator family protein [unclassified Dysgonomonas]